MAALPYMRFYVADYLADTGHLTALHHGAYVLLIMAYWRKGSPLPDDDVQLSQMARMPVRDWKKVRPLVADLFQVGGGLWVHNRIEIELERGRVKVGQAADAGVASGKVRGNGRSTNNGTKDLFESNDSDIRYQTSDSENVIPLNPPFNPKSPPCPPGVEPDTWEGFIELRKEKRAPITKRAYALILKEIGQSQISPDETIARSVMNGWTGVFAVVGGNNGRNRQDVRNGRDNRTALDRVLDEGLGRFER